LRSLTGKTACSSRNSSLVKGAYSLEPSELAANMLVLPSRLEHVSDMPDLFRVAAGEIRRLSGFDAS